MSPENRLTGSLPGSFGRGPALEQCWRQNCTLRPSRNGVGVYPDNILPYAASSRSGNTEHLKCLSDGIDGLLTPYMLCLPRAEPCLTAQTKR